MTISMEQHSVILIPVNAPCPVMFAAFNCFRTIQKSIYDGKPTKRFAGYLKKTSILRCLCSNTISRYDLKLAFKRSYSIGSVRKGGTSMIRNIGIIAHVDAGKTTTSERMLYYSGESQMLGDVDKGDTVLDYLKIERERGITINSAAITFQWRGHSINLIDTPDVDFTAEVERSVRVLDGAVAIFDGVAGVQAQTETVWAQANRYNVPRIAFVNKLDRDGAEVKTTIETMKSRLKANPLLVQIPRGESASFNGVVDLVRMEEIVWDEETLGVQYEVTPVDPESLLGGEAEFARTQMLEQLAEVDDAMMEYFLNGKMNELTPEMIWGALRRVTIAGTAIPVFLGAAFKNMGVQPIMDAIIDLLPSPLDRPSIIAYMADSAIFDEDDESGVSASNTGEGIQLACDPKKQLVAQAFKVVHEARSNSLVVYCRVYSGTLQSGQKLYNTTKGKEERSLRITRVCAEKYLDLKELQAGDIGAVTGLRNTATGDTLVALKDPKVRVLGMNIPEPVFWMSILADTSSDEDHLKSSLNTLQMEDPSFKWMINKETMQWLIGGQGELHLEIIRDRLFNYYKVKATTGGIQIAYKSTVKGEGTEHLIKTYFTGREEEVNMAVEVESLETGSGVSFVINESVFAHMGALKKQKAELVSAFNEAASEMIASGIPPGFPLQDTKITLTELQYNIQTAASTYKFGLMEAIFNAARNAGVQILEPIMKVEMTVDEKYVGGVITDLTSKRFASIDQLTLDPSGKRLVQCHVPLSALMGYSTDLRSLSKGSAVMSMEFAYNGPLSAHQQKQLLGGTFFG